MKAVIQRVTHAECVVDGNTVGAVGKGLLILLGAGLEDTEADCDKLADKISKLRIFSDENDKINLSIDDVGGDMLIISQFTLSSVSHKLRICPVVPAMDTEIGIIAQGLDDLTPVAREFVRMIRELCTEIV